MKLPTTQQGREDFARHLYFIVLSVIGGAIIYGVTRHPIAPFLLLPAWYLLWGLIMAIARFADWIEEGDGEGY